jgi:hypothetical protein
MNMRLDGGAAAWSTVMTKGIMYGQNDSASVTAFVTPDGEAAASWEASPILVAFRAASTDRLGPKRKTALDFPAPDVILNATNIWHLR